MNRFRWKLVLVCLGGCLGVAAVAGLALAMVGDDLPAPAPSPSAAPPPQAGDDEPVGSPGPAATDGNDRSASSPVRSATAAPPADTPKPSPPADPDGIDSFEDCAAAGYPIAESYPEQCFTPDGRGFTRILEPSGVQGTVLFGPVCPVERYPPDERCAPRPGAAQLRLVAAGKVVATAEAGEDGAFRIDAPAGSYRLTATSPVGGCTDQTVEIPPERIVEVTVACDTGIR